MGRPRRVAAAFTLSVGMSFAMTTPAGAVQASAPAAGADRQWSNRIVYLSLGDSLATGFQPGSGDDRDGGFAGEVRDVLRAPRRGEVVLTNLACSGEDTRSMITGGSCGEGRAAQLPRAERYLAAQGRRVRLITVSLGANDVQRCVTSKGGSQPTNLAIDRACVQTGLTNVARRLPGILSRLRAKAPQARIVVLNYYNPFLATWVSGQRAIAKESQPLVKKLNGIIAASAKRARADVADVATEFRTHDWTRVPLPSFGKVPRNVSVICSWTWMCSPFTDIHPDDTGYQHIAKAVLAELPRGMRR